MQVLIVCESPCIRSAHAKNRYFWLRHVGSRFLAKPMPAKNIVTGAMRKRFIRSPHRAGLLFPTYVTTSRPTTPTITTVKALLHHPSFEHLTSPLLLPATSSLYGFRPRREHDLQHILTRATALDHYLMRVPVSSGQRGNLDTASRRRHKSCRYISVERISPFQSIPPLVKG